LVGGRMACERICLREEIAFDRPGLGIKATNKVDCRIGGFHEFLGRPKALFLPFLCDNSNSQTLRNSELMPLNRAAPDLGNDLRYWHRPVEEILARLEIISTPAIKDISQRRIAVGDDFSGFKQSNDFTRAEAVRNLDNPTLSRVSNNTPLSARVDRKPGKQKDENSNNTQNSLHPRPPGRLSR